MRKNFCYKGKISKEKLHKGKKDKYKFFMSLASITRKYLCLLISSRPYPYKDDIPLGAMYHSQPQQLVWPSVGIHLSMCTDQ